MFGPLLTNPHKYAEGYRIEYDQDIPKFLNKYGKQWGASAGTTDIVISKYVDGSDITETVWSIPVNEEMKQSVLYEGQPMFSRGYQSFDDSDAYGYNLSEWVLPALYGHMLDSKRAEYKTGGKLNEKRVRGTGEWIFSFPNKEANNLIIITDRTISRVVDVYDIDTDYETVVLQVREAVIDAISKGNQSALLDQYEAAGLINRRNPNAGDESESGEGRGEHGAPVRYDGSSKYQRKFSERSKYKNAHIKFIENEDGTITDQFVQKTDGYQSSDEYTDLDTQLFREALREVGASFDGKKAKQMVSKAASNTFTRTPFMTKAEKSAIGVDETMLDYTYDPESEVESLHNAEARINADKAGELRTLPTKETFNGEDTDTAMFLLADKLEQARETGDYGDAKAWARMIQQKGTETGQRIQAFAKCSRTAEGLMVKTENILDQVGAEYLEC